MARADSVDPLDARLLLEVNDDPHATVVALAQKLGVARNTVQARLRRLEADGAITSFARRVNPEALGYELTAFLGVSVQQGRDAAVQEGLGAIPEVVEIHAATGDADLRLRVVARDPADLYRLAGEIVGVPGVVRTSTAMVLKELLPYRTEPLLQRIVDERERRPER